MLYKTAVVFISLFVCVFALTNFERSEIHSLWRNFPLKMFMNISMLQGECRRAFQNILELSTDYDLDALKVLDSTGKLPSGILNGNVNQYGDFDQCMEIKEAQYCLAEIDLEPSWQPPHSTIRKSVHSFYAFKENFNDPAHRVPGFNLIRWGFCIPSQCSSEDLKESLKINFGLSAEIRPGMCQKALSQEKELYFGDYFTRVFFVLLIFVVIVSSLLDYAVSAFAENKYFSFIFQGIHLDTGTIGQLLICFSLQRNISKLFHIQRESSDEIAGLHGIRALNAFGLLMSHKSISLFFNPYVNRTFIINKYSRPWTILVKNAIIYTDGFLLLSGLLNANSLLTELMKSGTMRFWNKLNKRLFRILPNIIFLILFCTYILPSFGAGPLWPIVVDYHAVLCKKYMWRNIFFIHNYFNFEDMCLTHTHQLGIDMQLFLVTPILVYFIWKMKKVGLTILTLLALASTILRYVVTYENELSPVVYFGITISKMFKTANLSYILPTHRATIYFMGVFMAYFLKSLKETMVNRVQMVALWCIFFVLFFTAWLGPYSMALRNYVYDKTTAASIAALTPIFWGSGISFGIYVTNRNIAGWLGNFLTWKYFQIGTRLAYALYLVQFPIFFFNVGLTKHPDEYHYYYQAQIFETCAIFGAAVMLVLLIEMPFLNMYKVLFERRQKNCEEKEVCSSQNYNVSKTRKVKFG